MKKPETIEALTIETYSAYRNGMGQKPPSWAAMDPKEKRAWSVAVRVCLGVASKMKTHDVAPELVTRED